MHKWTKACSCRNMLTTSATVSFRRYSWLNISTCICINGQTNVSKVLNKRQQSNRQAETLNLNSLKQLHQLGALCKIFHYNVNKQLFIRNKHIIPGSFIMITPSTYLITHFVLFTSHVFLAVSNLIGICKHQSTLYYLTTNITDPVSNNLIIFYYFIYLCSLHLAH